MQLVCRGEFQFKQQPESRCYEALASIQPPDYVSIQAAARKPLLPQREVAQAIGVTVSIQAAARKPLLPWQSVTLSGFYPFQFKQQPESRCYLDKWVRTQIQIRFNSSSSPKAAATLGKILMLSSPWFQFKQQPESRCYLWPTALCRLGKTCFNSSSSPKAAATQYAGIPIAWVSFQFKQQPESRCYLPWAMVAQSRDFVSIQAAARKPLLPITDRALEKTAMFQFKQQPESRCYGIWRSSSSIN